MCPTPGLNHQAPTMFVTWPWGSRTPQLPCQLVLSPNPGLAAPFCGSGLCAVSLSDLIMMTQWSEQLPAFGLDLRNIFGSMFCRPRPSSQSSLEHWHQARLFSFLFPKEHPECGHHLLIHYLKTCPWSLTTHPSSAPI